MLAAWALGTQPELVILSAELMLVPGAVMVSSVADLSQGDTVSPRGR